MRTVLIFRRAAAIVLLVSAGGATLYACGPDKETEALRQENAALRREAENHEAIYGSKTPLTDAARAAAGLSAGSSSKTTSKLAAGAGVPDITQDDIDEATRLGLPVYPNAKLSRQPGARDDSVLTGGGVNIVLLETPDKLEPVVAFYQDKMALSNADQHIPGSRKPPARADRTQDKFRVVTLSDMQPGGGMRSVTIHEDVGKCYIELMNITGKQQIPASVTPPVSQTPPSAKTESGSPSGSTKTSATTSAPSTGSAKPSGSSPVAQPGQTSESLPTDNDPLKPPPLLPGGKQ